MSSNVSSSSMSSSSSRPNKHRRSIAVSNSTTNHELRYKSIIREREAQIDALQKEKTALTNEILSLKRQYKASKRQFQQAASLASTPKRKHILSPYGNVVHESDSKNPNSGSLTHERARMGRNASIATAKELSSLTCPKEESRHNTNQNIVNRILAMFNDPASHINYLNSIEFANDLRKLNSKIRKIFEAEPRVAFLQSPVYVFGDIHGNLEDLHFFSDNIWRLGMNLTAGNFLFLGDYVDRGMSCLECIAYLFAMKLLMPQKIFLLRGNHETRDVNGWEEHYGVRSFLYQCRSRFGNDLGYKVWEEINSAFDRMPLAAVIDQDIFAVHGGIPRPITKYEDGSFGSRIQDILNVPNVAGINPPNDNENECYQQVASDCIWSDPASEDQERNGVDTDGYGESLRGGGAICFGHKAVKDFLEQHNFSYIMRAHEAHADGVAVSKGGKVFTIFSTSKDHNQGREAMAGCILVDFENLQVINRSHAYRNVYVHRRDSVSIAKLTENEIEERIRLGLVTENDDDDDDEYEYEVEYEDDEEWEDMETEGEQKLENEEGGNDENFGFSIRRSSVIPEDTIASPTGSGDNLRWPHFDLSKVETKDRRSKRECQRLSVITTTIDEEDEGPEDTSFGMEFDDEKKITY